MSMFTVVILALMALGARAEPTQVVWCVPYDQPPAYADLCTKTLAPANTEDVEFSCVIGGTSEGCMELISSGEAHLTTFDGGDMMDANNAFDMTPLLFENYGGDVGTSYYAVAAVNKEFCDEETTLETLRGTRSCHTGYRKTAGWLTPLGALLRSGVMTPVKDEADIQDDAETVAGFFSGGVCAPRVTASGPKRGGLKWDDLCSGCTGDCTTHDKYYDYQGAFRCLHEGGGDVAFIKHSTIPDYAKGGKKAEEWGTKPADDFMLICPSGGCKPVDEYRSCSMARVPAHAVVSPGSFAVGGEMEELGKAIQDALVAASKKDGFLESANQLNGQKNFIFKSSTVGLDPVTTSFEDAIGGDFIAEYKAVADITSDDDGDR